MKDNPQICAEVEKKVRELFNLEADVAAQEPAAEGKAADGKTAKAAKEKD